MLRILLQETFVVEDLWWYKPTVDSDFTRTTSGSEYVYTLNNPVALPSAPFEIKFTTTRQSTSNGVVYFSIGDTNTWYDIGALRNKGSLSIRKVIGNLSNSSLLADQNSNNVIPLAETENTYTYNGSKHTVTSGSTTLTANETTTISYFRIVTVNPNCTLKEIKVKAL